jgi:hypothetical protein
MSLPLVANNAADELEVIGKKLLASAEATARELGHAVARMAENIRAAVKEHETLSETALKPGAPSPTAKPATPAGVADATKVAQAPSAPTVPSASAKPLTPTK